MPELFPPSIFASVTHMTSAPPESGSPITPRYQAHVDVVSKLLIAGWAACESEDGAPPTIEIVQDGKVKLLSRPGFPAPRVWQHLGAPHRKAEPCLWRIYFPLAQGLAPDRPFDVRVAESGRVAYQGRDRVLPFVHEKFQGAYDAILQENFLRANYARLGPDEVEVKIAANWADASACAVTIGDETRELPAIREPSHLFGRRESRLTIPIRPEIFGRERGAVLRIGMAGEPGDGGASDDWRFRQRLRSVIVPRTLVSEKGRIGPVPAVENIRRVNGPLATELNYWIGGATTFWQLDQLTQKYAGAGIRKIGRVVDWGVGCGRVLRQFWEMGGGAPPARAADLIGLDIDPVNVQWCKDNIGDYGAFDLLHTDRGFDIESASVDMIFGISVMTHLSEANQAFWLAEINRILKPGGLAILTTHGEAYFLRFPRTIQMPFLEQFGFFDGMPDDAIGKEMNEYYRATYQSTAYTRKNWSRDFEILDIIPGTNAFVQDYVILRKPRPAAKKSPAKGKKKGSRP